MNVCIGCSTSITIISKSLPLGGKKKKMIWQHITSENTSFTLNFGFNHLTNIHSASECIIVQDVVNLFTELH